MKGSHQEGKARRAREHGVPVNNACCVVEYRAKIEVDAAQMRDGLIAFQHGYDLLTIMSLSPLAQETYWKLKNAKDG